MIILNPIKQYAYQEIYQPGSKKQHHFIRINIYQTKHENPSNKPSKLALNGPVGNQIFALKKNSMSHQLLGQDVGTYGDDSNHGAFGNP